MPDILLIHTVSQPQIRYGRLQKAAGRTAPFGVACLAAAFPGRVTWTDLQAGFPEISDAAAVDAPRLKAVVVQGASGWDEETSAYFAQALGNLFPQALKVLGGVFRPRFAPHWDITVHGTGRTLIASILSGEIHSPNGSPRIIETIPDDLRNPLPVPEEPLDLSPGYSASVEKCMGGPTAAIYQPWIGLLDRTRSLGVEPQAKFLESLLPWLHRSGYVAAAFESPVFSSRHYCDLQDACAHQEMPFSLAVADPVETAAIAQLPQGFLARLWLKPGSQAEMLDAFARIADRFEKFEVSLCLRLDREAAGDPELCGLGQFIDELSLENPQEWDFMLLRRTLVDFYLRQKHLWKRVMQLRSARDLLTLLRGAYGLFDLFIRK